MKKTAYTLLIAGCSILLASCGSGRSGDNDKDSSSRSDSAPKLSVPTDADSTPQPSEGSEAAPEEDLDQLVDRLCQSQYLTDSNGNNIPDPDYLPVPDFGQLSENSVFDVSWNTTEGSYMAGTSFLMETDLTQEPLLITAIHYFGEEAYISGAELADYVTGGELYDILKDGSAADGSVRSVVTVSDAAGFGDAKTCGKDVAAFTVDGLASMNAFPIASEPCQPGDVIYLAAYLSQDGSYTYDDFLYPCIVLEDDGTEMYYVLADVFLTGGASGAPLLNSRGEVVGIHIASGGSTRYGHSVQSIYEQLEIALSAR
ncbi:MAG: serine protease [Firmicutes bacterium]|nr:serine protease [Bacillota bacterium]